MTTADRDKFLKIVALLASDRAGERDAAALATMRFLRQRKLDWDDVIERPGPVLIPPRYSTAPLDWRKTVAACLGQPGGLRQWEVGFLRNLREFPRLSAKQAAILREIAERLGVLAECAA